MSIATEQKVERLLLRMDDLEMQVAELRQIVEAKSVTPPPSKEPAGGRATLNLKK